MMEMITTNPNSGNVSAKFAGTSWERWIRGGDKIHEDQRAKLPERLDHMWPDDVARPGLGIP
jgi:hypothetical protein